MPEVKMYLPLSSLTFKQPGYLRKKYLPRYLLLGYLPFYRQGYCPFWFEFSQNFVRFRESTALLVARRTNNRKVVGSMPAKSSVYHSVDR